MVKRLTSFVLSVALIVGLVNGCPSKVNAATETYTSGDYTYTLVENKSGDYDANISSYTGTETNVNVPGTLDGYKVISIGDNAFKNNTDMVSVTINDNIEAIGKESFLNLKKLSNVKLSSNIKTIERSAFRGCVKLKTIEIPASMENTAMTHDYNGPFSASGLESVTFEEGTEIVAARLFKNCTELKSIEIPDTVKTIGAEAFKGAGLETVKLSKNLETIGNSAFEQCTSLEAIDIPDSVTSIGTEAFYKDTSLGSLKLSKNIKTIDRSAFRECTSLKSVEIPASLENTAMTHDYNGPFSASGLESVTFEEGTEIVAARLFKNCKELKTIEIPDTVKTIGAEAFRGTGLETVKLSKNLETIGNSAFEQCTSLEAIDIPDSVTSIGTEAFYKDTSLGSLKLSKNIKTIDRSAFRECTSLKSVEIPASLENTAMTHDYNGPFSASGLESVTFEEGTEIVAARLFKNCTELKSIEIPDTVKTIGSEAFKGAGLETVKLSKNLETIGNSAFEQCTSLEAIDIPDSVTSIGTEAFYKDTSLGSLKLSKNIKTIDRSAFRECTSLKSVEIPASLENTAMTHDYNGPFSESGLCRVSFEEGTKVIVRNLFKGCKQLESIEIPNSVTSIGSSAFENCTALNSIKLSDTLTSIGNNSFNNCTSLEKVTLPKSLKELGEGAFKSCGNLSEVYFQDKLTTLGKQAFANDPIIEAFSPEYSNTSCLLIDNDVSMSFSDSHRTESATDVIDWNVTSFEMSDTSASGYIPVILKYEIKEKYADKVSNMKLTFGKSESSGISSIKIDGVQCEYTTDRVGHVLLSLSKPKGTITFYMSPNDNGKIACYTKLDCTNGNNSYSGILGVISERTSCLTIGTNETIAYESGDSSVVAHVKGFADRQKDVDIYLDDAFMGTVISSANGIYSSDIILDSPTNYKAYRIKAVSTNSRGNEVSVEKTVYSVLEAPILTEAVLYIEAHDYKGGSATFDLLDSEGKIKYITFQPGKKYEYRLKYNHPEKLKKVLVVSTRNGARSVLEANWDASTESYITKGFFNNDSSYTPGNISVEIIQNTEKTTVTDKGEMQLSDKDKAAIPKKWKTATLTPVSQSENNYEATINLGDGTKVDYTYDKISFTEFADALKSEYILNNSTKTVVSGFLETNCKNSLSTKSKPKITQSQLSDLADILEVSGDDGEYYSDLYSKFKAFGFVEYMTGEADFKEDAKALIKMDYSDEEIIMFIINPSSCDNNILKYAIKRGHGEYKKSIIEMVGDKDAGGFLYSMGGSIIEFEGSFLNLAMAKANILADPTLTEAQRQAKLEELDMMRDIACEKLIAQYLSAVLMTIGATTGVTGIGIAAVILSKIIDNVIIPMIESGDLDRFMKGEISLEDLLIRWILDPSGYVYEGVTSNRLEDVVVTIYYKDSESSTKETLWNAEEYGQENPLTTDSFGRYAWDVPEGYWRVKCEKSGYNTSYSDWLPVPPPQMDVNIAMVPTKAPEVKSIDIYENSAIISFTQYMDPDTISNIQLKDSKGKSVTYELSYDKTETDANGNVYAKEYTLVYDKVSLDKGDSIEVIVPDSVKSSAGESASESTSTGKADKDIEFNIYDVIHLKKGESYEIPYSVSGADKVSIEADVENPDLVKIDSISKPDSLGKGKISVSGLEFGSTRITVNVKDTGITKLLDVKVDTYNSVDKTDNSEEEQQKQEMDQNKADVVIALINDLGEITEDSKDAIEEAREAYNDLTKSQKKLVTNLSVLEEAEDDYNKMTNNYTATPSPTTKPTEPVETPTITPTESTATPTASTAVPTSNSSDPTMKPTTNPVVPTTNPTGVATPTAVPSTSTVKAPGKVTVKSAKNTKKRKIVVKWKKISGAKKYEIQCARNKKFTNSVTTKTTNKLKVTFKGLSKKKTYYVRVRAYKINASGDKVYGKWSKVKKVKVKK